VVRDVDHDAEEGQHRKVEVLAAQRLPLVLLARERPPVHLHLAVGGGHRRLRLEAALGPRLLHAEAKLERVARVEQHGVTRHALLLVTVRRVAVAVEGHAEEVKRLHVTSVGGDSVFVEPGVEPELSLGSRRGGQDEGHLGLDPGLGVHVVGAACDDGVGDGVRGVDGLVVAVAGD